MPKQNPRREQVLERLWEIASMSPEMTRGSMTGQVKALSMIVAMEGVIPDRSAEKKSTPAPDNPQIHPAPRLAEQPEKAIHPEPGNSQKVPRKVYIN